MIDKNLSSAEIQDGQLFPETSKTALQNRVHDPEYLLANMAPELASKTVLEWRDARNKPNIPKARSKSQAEYQKNYLRLVHNYAKELDIDQQEIRPDQIVRQMLSHATSLSKATWRLYRYSLIHIFNEQALLLAEQNKPHTVLLKSLATLITFSEKPYPDMREEEYSGKQVRIKSIASTHFDEIINVLANGPKAEKSVKLKRTQSFAIATIATGIRPGEWIDATIRTATDEDMNDGSSSKGWAALTINTSKRKSNEQEWVRTLLIAPGQHQIHIYNHIRMVQEFTDESKGVDPFPIQYIRKCSGALRALAKQLWPRHPERWITLYSLRSQARANIVSIYGAYLGAAMLGHSPEKSAHFYAGAHRSNLPRTGTAGVLLPKPAPNCMVKAAEFAQRIEGKSSEKLGIGEMPGSGQPI